MSEPSLSRCVVSFGAYQCNPSAGELRKSGVKVKISDQPLRLLAILLERPGEMFTRQELGERLWPAGTFVEFEDSLNTAVNKLRTALDDPSENPRFIETIPRHGYRFIAPIKIVVGNGQNGTKENLFEVTPGKEESQTDPLSSPARTAERARYHSKWILGATTTVLFAFAVWWYTPLPPPSIVRIDQITTNARIDTPVKPVSDSADVYYIERDGDHWTLMRAPINGGDSQRVAVPMKSAMAMDISTDGGQLLLGSFEKRDGQNQLWTVSAQGTATRQLGATGATAAFSPNGRQIVYSQQSALWIMDADGRNARKLSDLPQTPGWIAWSPDGRRLRFSFGTLFGADETSIWEMTSDGRNLHAVLPGWTHPSSECCGAWTPDGRYYIFTSERGGHANLWALRESGSFWRRSPHGPFQLTSGPDSPWGGTPSHDGRLILFYNGVWREEMQDLDLKTEHFSPANAGVNAEEANFTRDGKWVSYIERNILFRSRVDGADRIELAPQKVNPSFPRWSPDGKWIVFDEHVPGQAGMSYVVPSDGGTPRALLPGSGDVRDPDWSDTGRSLVVSRAANPNKSDIRELLIVDFATGHTDKIPGSEGLAASRWSPDGSFISSTTADQSQLKIWNVSRRQWSVIAHGAALGISVWSPDSRYLYFQDLLGKGEALFRYEMRDGHVEQVADFTDALRSGADRCGFFGIEPDGSPVIGFNRSAYDLFAARMRFP